MGSNLWGKLSVLALCSAFVTGCANGPEKDRKVLGAHKGSPPYGSAQTTQPPPGGAFPRVDSPNLGGVPKSPPTLPPISPPPNGVGAISGPGGVPTLPVSASTPSWPPAPNGGLAPINPPVPPSVNPGFGTQRDTIQPLPLFPAK